MSDFGLTNLNIFRYFVTSMFYSFEEDMNCDDKSDKTLKHTAYESGIYTIIYINTFSALITSYKQKHHVTKIPRDRNIT